MYGCTDALDLVPTRVGMIGLACSASYPAISCPHTRGDDRKENQKLWQTQTLSPHAWDVHRNTNANTTTETFPHTRGMFLTSLFCVLTPPDRKHIRAEPISLSSGGNFSHLCSFRRFHPFSFSVFFNSFSFVRIIVFHKITLLTGCPVRRVKIAITTGLTYFLNILLYICVVCLNRLYAEVFVCFK